MKVHMIMAALAAASLSAQGVAQQGEDSLERALADLNSGLTASAASNVDISGEARIRNLYTSGGNSKMIDGRYMLRFGFEVNEQVGGVLGITGFETWGSQVVDKVVVPNDSNIDTRIDLAYFYGNDVFGDGGKITIGRKYYTLGSGRILGSDDWDQAPQIQTGFWYNHEAGGANVEIFLLNSQHDEDAAASIGNSVPSYDDLFGITFDWVFETDSSLGNVHFSPYILSGRDGGLSLEDGWYLGTQIAGELVGFGWDAEWVTQDEDDSAMMGGGQAFALSTTIGLDALESIPGVEDGGLMLQVTGADDDFSPIMYPWGAPGAIRHGVASLRDFLPNGVWSTDTDTLTAQLGFAPGENWNGKIAYWAIENMGADTSAWDLQIGTTIAGAVDLWFGYSHTSSDDLGMGGAAADDDIIWTTIGTAF